MDEAAVVRTEGALHDACLLGKLGQIHCYAGCDTSSAGVLLGSEAEIFLKETLS